jgi:hypothetical protein
LIGIFGRLVWRGLKGRPKIAEWVHGAYASVGAPRC